jgi:hypothetical protein
MTQAMRGIAEWATNRPYRTVLLTIVFAQLLAPIAAGLLVLDALRRGPVAAAISALISLVAIGLGGLTVGAGLGESVGLPAPVLAGAVAAGGLLGAYRSLALSFQVTLLGAIGLTVAAYALVPGADGLGEYLLGETLSLLESLGVTGEQLTVFATTPPSLLVETLLMYFVISVLSGLMLGFWWYSLLTEGVRFGAAFRALRLGRVAGIGLMLLFLLRIVVDSELIQIAAQLAVIGFLFQGLAVMHARSRSDHWHGAIIVLVYVALLTFTPLMLIAIAGLSVVGLLDNFFALRARVGPED